MDGKLDKTRARLASPLRLLGRPQASRLSALRVAKPKARRPRRWPRPGRWGLLVASLLLPLVVFAAISTAEVVQIGNLRITLLSQVLPYKLPRSHPAPIAVFVAGHVDTANGEQPEQLQRLQIEINRHGLLQAQGLPTCRAPEVEASSTQRALARCAQALIGSGQFWAHIVLPDQPPYPTRGRLLIFNGRDERGHPLILASIYAVNPFPTSFVIPFHIAHLAKGPYGTRLVASFPHTLGEWGYLERIKLTLRRKYDYRGRQLSYFNASCPAPKGTPRISYPLASANFRFHGGKRVQVSVPKSCRVKE